MTERESSPEETTFDLKTQLREIILARHDLILKKISGSLQEDISDLMGRIETFDSEREGREILEEIESLGTAENVATGLAELVAERHRQLLLEGNRFDELIPFLTAERNAFTDMLEDTMKQGGTEPKDAQEGNVQDLLGEIAHLDALIQQCEAWARRN